MERVLYLLMKHPVPLRLFFFHPRKFVFGVTFLLFWPLTYLFAGVFLGNGWSVVTGVATVMAGIYTAMRLRVSAWQKLEDEPHE